MAAPIIIQLGAITGRIHDYGTSGVVDIDTYPRGLTFAVARAALGRAVVDGRVRIPNDVAERFGVGEWFDGEHSLRFTAEGSA